MKQVLYICMGLLMVCSCRPDTESQLVGKWQQTAQSNSTEENIIRQQQHYVDTMGRSTTPEQNLMLYHTTNMDSLRAYRQSQIDSMKLIQQEMVNNTLFEFRKDKIAVMNVFSYTDSATWYLSEDGRLVIDEQKLKGGGNVFDFEIVQLTRDSLTLKNKVEDNIIITSFRAVR